MKLVAGGSPGLVVMGGDSCSKGCEFELWHHVQDGHFFTFICCKICIICLKRLKINEKEAGVGHFLKITCRGRTWQMFKFCKFNPTFR